MNWWPFTRKPLRIEALRWPWPAERRPLRVEHVRYVKEQAVSTRKTAIDLARQIGRNDLADRLEALGG